MPETLVTVRTRQHHPFYDHECRQARRMARRMERIYRKWKRKESAKESDALNSWRTVLRASRRLVRKKGRQTGGLFESASKDTGRTWKNVDKLLGKVDICPSLPESFSAEDFHQYIEDKIDGIRQRMPGAESVYYIPWG